MGEESRLGGSCGGTDEVCLALPERFGIADGDEWRTRLVDALAGASTVVVDAAAVGMTDVAGIQLLIAARRSAGQAGKRFRLAAPADGAFREALVTAGFLAAGQPHEMDGFWQGEG